MSTSDDAIRAWKDADAAGHHDDHPAGVIDLGAPWSKDPTTHVTMSTDTATDGGWELFFPDPPKTEDA